MGTLGWSYDQTAVTCAIALERPHNGTAWQHFMPSGPLAVLPLPGNRASIVWSDRPDKAKALLDLPTPAFESLLQRRLGDEIGPARLVGPRFAYPLSLQLSERGAAPRLALLGDTAHGVHPIAGQGLNLGLKDVAVLAEVLTEARRVGEDIGSAVVLERYLKWRRFDTGASMAAADLIARGFSNDFPPLRLVRDAALATAGALSPLRRILAREAGAGLGDLPELLRSAD
jgi:2-octaprenyl-6-methoxyphenol hydroxylase